MDHLENEVPPPKEIPLLDGQFEVGREDSAQLTIRLPTVSARHAMLRVGETLANFPQRRLPEINELHPPRCFSR